MKILEKTFNNQSVRIINKDGEQWFVLVDICNILGIANPSDAVSNHEKDDLDTTEVIDALGRKQKTRIVNESGLYQLIFKSRKSEAKKFKKWVTSEVLPSIRKTGKYSIPEQVKQISTKNRNILTDEWKSHGIEKRHEYIQLTLQEYKSLNFEKGKKKKDLSKGETLLLSALESMEAFKLFNDNKINGYEKCKNSLNDTALKIKNHLLEE